MEKEFEEAGLILNELLSCSQEKLADVIVIFALLVVVVALFVVSQAMKHKAVK